MRNKKEGKRGKAIFIIADLIIAVAAFSFLISLADAQVPGLPSIEESLKPMDLRLSYHSTPTTNIILTATNPPPAPPVAPPVKVAEAFTRIMKPGDPFSGFLLGNSVNIPGIGAVPLSEVRFNADLSQLMYKNKIYEMGAGNKLVEVGTSGTGGAAASSNILGALAADSIISSLFYAGVIGLVGYLGGGMFGLSKNNQKALGVAAFAGAMTYQILSPILTGKGLNLEMWGGGKAVWGAKATEGLPLGLANAGQAQLLSLGIAVGVGLLVLNMLWKKESKKQVVFECKPYEAPTGGKYCELCNKDLMRPCSEYRCKSLGQGCDVVPSKEGLLCYWKNPHDVTSPTIAPWLEVLSKGHSYKDVNIRPPRTGMRVTRDAASDGCIKAFTPITFGISTNEPTQCKIDYNHTVNVRDVKNAYSNMQFYFGESNLYDYNHSQTLRLPSPSAMQNASPELKHDGIYTLYVRCQDGNGNINEDEFAIRFCVEKGPDTTPPEIVGTSIPSGMPFQFGLNETDIEVYTNEPADCRWSKQDKDYDLMENTMTCAQNVWNINNNMLYKCYTTLNGLENRKDNQFFFRCRDQPTLENQNDRNTNAESYPFILKGTQPVNILKTGPNGTVQGYANVVSVDLEVETGNGFNNGDAMCYYSQQNTDSSYIKMFETGSSKHKQNQQLPPGTYTYYFKCVDLGNNADYNSTKFTVQVDRQAPFVTRLYNEGGKLRIETNEKSTCYYSEAVNQKCNFALNTGTQLLYANTTYHYTDWKTSTNYYIKCVDSSGNQPNPADCTIIARMYNSAS
ncbi:RDD family protein [Candidatus Pacearchaeota archaeon]|nr:RDD family protein [Candidatus Pacearchaeota archaeon]